MLKSYFTLIIRSLGRNKTFSLINLAGLSIGLAGFILIGLYVVDEFSFDRHHLYENRIYQLSISVNYEGQVRKWVGVPNKTAPTLAREIPEIEKAFRILPNNFSGKAFVSSSQIKSSENHLVWADTEIFDVLTMPFVRGTHKDALKRPHTVVITEASAIKYFGTLEALVQTLRIDRDTTDFEVTGIIQNPLSNSRFQFPIIASFAGTWFDQPNSQSWGNASFETYILLHENTSIQTVEKKITEALERNIPKDDRWFSLSIHPLKDIHLHYPDVEDNGAVSKGDMSQLMILMVLGLIILIIAAVNYMNLSTAQSQRRFKEIGISKTLGATRRQLAQKFYLETSVFVMMAMAIGLLFVLFMLPFFNSITGKEFNGGFLSTVWFWLAAFAVWMSLTVLAGVYPALYLSSFSPRQVLKGSPSGLGGNAILRKALVVSQFAISSILIVSTLILQQQLGFMRDKKLGYQPEQVIAIETTGAQNRNQVIGLRNSLLELAVVTGAARSQSYPGSGASGRNLPGLDGQGTGINLSTVRATPEVLDVLGIHLLAGKTLPEKADSDTTVQIILNKTAVDHMGLTPDEAVGRKLKGIFEGEVELVGVTEDFHFSSLRQPIGAYCFHNAKTEGYNVLLVKLQTNNIAETLAQVQQAFNKNISTAFQYTFLDQQMESLYKSEQQLGKMTFIFAGLAIFIACMGLYALAAYTTEQRTKEIGIRKVMGASVMQLSGMLSGDFLKLVVISFLIAVPLAYYFMSRWQEGFAYRVEITFMVFLVAGLLSVFIAWATVGLESFKAARSNPIQSLRNE